MARKLLPLHDRIHEAEAALRVVNMKDLVTLQVATKVMVKARLLAAPLPALANLIERAVRILNGEGDAETILSGRRLAQAKALILMAHDELHRTDPHPPADHRLN
jgi:hypothetical protein